MDSTDKIASSGPTNSTEVHSKVQMAGANIHPQLAQHFAFLDLSTHPHARSVVAKSMLKRMAIDIKWFANKANLSSAPKIKHLLDDELNRNVFVTPSIVATSFPTRNVLYPVKIRYRHAFVTNTREHIFPFLIIT